MEFFPSTRLRRNRSNGAVRRLVREHRLTVDDLVQPLFIGEMGSGSEAIVGMADIFCHSIESVLFEIERVRELGITAVALFPRVDSSVKDVEGSIAVDSENLICRALRASRERFPDMVLISDVALDPFTSHGHDGILRDGEVLNDETCEVLVRQALVQAEAGCDTLAPSDMMDGRIGIIRAALDSHGFEGVRLLSYAVKYASSFYAPFRGALGSAKLEGDKSTYQMDCGNVREALREARMDIGEGADMLMVKPGGIYLDVIRVLSDNFDIPILAYQVSGEYSMLANAVNQGVLPEGVIMESLLAFKRAGACGIFSYFASSVAERLREMG